MGGKAAVLGGVDGEVFAEKVIDIRTKTHRREDVSHEDKWEDHFRQRDQHMQRL